MTKEEKTVAMGIFNALSDVMRNTVCPVTTHCCCCSNDEVCGSAVKLLHQIEKKLKEAGE